MTPIGLLDELNKYQRFLVIAHENPDGDAIGSCAAMGWILQALGKDVCLYNPSGLPGSLSWLPLPAQVCREVEALPWLPNAIVALDSGDQARLGQEIQPLLAHLPLFNIDHHRGNSLYGTAFNWVDPAMSAVGEMMGELAQSAGLPLQGALAQAIYIALETDTGSFSYDNTTEGSLRLTAEMLHNGLALPELSAKLANNWTTQRFYLWGKLVEQTQILEQGRLAACLVSRDLLDQYQAGAEALDGFSEHLRRIATVRVALVIRELSEEPARSKASLRSSGSDDVGMVAAYFGGGGHRNAAGVTLPLKPEAALTRLLPQIRNIWD